MDWIPLALKSIGFILVVCQLSGYWTYSLWPPYYHPIIKDLKNRIYSDCMILNIWLLFLLVSSHQVQYFVRSVWLICFCCSILGHDLSQFFLKFSENSIFYLYRFQCRLQYLYCCHGILEIYFIYDQLVFLEAICMSIIYIYFYCASRYSVSYYHWFWHWFIKHSSVLCFFFHISCYLWKSLHLVPVSCTT